MANQGELRSKIYFLLLSFLSVPVFAINPTENHPNLWTRDQLIPPGNPRKNIFNYPPELLNQYFQKGKLHTLSYPVSITGAALPYPYIQKVLRYNPFDKLPGIPSDSIHGLGSLEELYEFLGLAHYQSEEKLFSYSVPRPQNMETLHRVGADAIPTINGRGITFSCTACHASNFFGHTIWGLPNKNTKANYVYDAVKEITRWINPSLVSLIGQMTPAEDRMLRRTLKNLKSIGTREPQVAGLDTSIAHVAKSLAHRKQDEYATHSRIHEMFPRSTVVDKKIVADSKPGTFWSVKHKNRWLSDGSVVSGNPILTNILWNEIGRGSDLTEVEAWVESNSKAVEELTAAIFASEAPRWNEIFPENRLNLASAMRGEKIFNQTCSRCHGVYEKAWTDPKLQEPEIFKTTRVVYHARTPVFDVGTDPGRYLGMEALKEPLNNLHFSKRFNILIETQKGYVPPPLEGIFARYPYFHNNSAPNLCAVLTPAPLRPTTFVQGPSVDPQTDFDFDCVGYPTGDKIPASWFQKKNAFFNTKKQGLSNAGHDSMLIDAQGNEKLSANEKQDLIEFLKTL